MEATMINPDDIDCIAYLNKKRKLDDELLSLPSPKHICWSEKLPKMVRSNIFVRGVESEPESASFSYSFPADADFSISSHDDAKTYLSYPKPSTASSTSQFYPYSPETRLLTKASSTEFESPSVSEELHSLYLEYGLKLPYIDDHCSLSACENDVNEGCMDVDNQLHSNEGSGSNFVLSSGRWTVNQDGQEGSRKLTIDKEFEQYFSALML